MPLPSLAPFRRALPLLKRQRRAFLLGAACLIPAVLLDLAIPKLLKQGIDDATARTLTAARLGAIAAAVLLLGALSSLLGYGKRRLFVRASRDFERDLRQQIFQKLLTLPPAFFGQATIGDLVSRMTQDVEATRMALGPGVMYVADAVTRVGLAFAVMVTQDARLTAWMAVPIALLGAVAFFIAPRIGRASDAVQDGIAAISARATESFAGVRVLKLFTSEEREHARMERLGRAYLDAQMKLASARGGMMALLFLVKDSSQFVILLVGGLHVLAQRASLGDFVAFREWMLQCFWPLVTFGWIISMVQRAGAGMKRIAAVLDVEPQLRSPPEPRRAVDRGALAIEWRGVTVTLGGKRVLDRVSLAVAAGTSLGVTGRTGSGKSTLAQLVPRLLDPDEGQLLVGGIDAREWELDELRRAVGFVPQETFLFSDLLRENLRFARPDADDRLVLAAARQADLQRDLAELPQGLDTRVGERGVTLSGGQRQRATLARALLVDPPVLVLDDCLSAVDAETEARILAELKRALAGRTAIVVSHRVAALAGLDRVAFLEEGRLVELGTHAELVRARGRYARLERDQRLLAELEAL